MLEVETTDGNMQHEEVDRLGKVSTFGR